MYRTYFVLKLIWFKFKFKNVLIYYASSLYKCISQQFLGQQCQFGSFISLQTSFIVSIYIISSKLHFLYIYTYK